MGLLNGLDFLNRIVIVFNFVYFFSRIIIFK